MPSKKSKTQNTTSQWKQESDCSEKRLLALATELAHEIHPGDRVILEGPMGVGKTTFTRALLSELGVLQPPEGSPSFAIAHEYESPRGPVIHLDYYRIRHESEIDEAGIPSYYWEREPRPIVISEWLSNWSEFCEQVISSGRSWKVILDFSDSSEDDSQTRKLDIRLLNP